MSDRITQSMLDNAIEQLNDGLKCKYASNDAYGYAQLSQKMPSTTGISNISLGNTKKELYYQIKFALDILSNEKRPENHMSACVHYDNFNAREKFEDRGLIHKFNDKVACISCGKTGFSHNEYDANHEKINAKGELKK